MIKMDGEKVIPQRKKEKEKEEGKREKGKEKKKEKKRRKKEKKRKPRHMLRQREGRYLMLSMESLMTAQAQAVVIPDVGREFNREL